MKKSKQLVAALGILLASMTVGPAAAVGFGSLDPRFAQDGRAVVPAIDEYLLDAALLPDRRVVVVTWNQLVAILPSGQVDREFGKAGRVRLAGPPGAKAASFGTVSVDSEGRIVVVGSCDFAERTGVHNMFEGVDRPRQMMIRRFTPDGMLDPTFGDDGTALTDFGLPPAGPGFAPRLFLQDATLDGLDRILISGHRRTPSGEEAFVGRLSAEGEDDASFATAGAYSPADYRWVGRPVADEDGGVFFMARRGFRERFLLHLGEDGRPDRRFGEDGGRPVSGTAKLSSLSLDPAGRIVFANQLQGRPGRLPKRIRIRRLLSDGSLDRDFAEKAAVIRVPRLDSWTLATDDRGGIMLAMELKNTNRRNGPYWRPVVLGLMRLREDGVSDQSFGRNGFLGIRFGPRNQETDLAAFDIQGTRALVAATQCTSSCRAALAGARLDRP